LTTGKENPGRTKTYGEEERGYDEQQQDSGGTSLRRQVPGLIFVRNGRQGTRKSEQVRQRTAVEVARRGSLKNKKEQERAPSKLKGNRVADRHKVRRTGSRDAHKSKRTHGNMPSSQASEKL